MYQFRYGLASRQSTHLRIYHDRLFPLLNRPGVRPKDNKFVSISALIYNTRITLVLTWKKAVFL